MIDLPDFDKMSPEHVRRWGDKLIAKANEFGEIRATLLVNCMPGRSLGDLGAKYDESKSVLTNLCYILETLTFQIQEAKR